MKRLTIFALLSALCVVLSIQYALAGPFGIDMGMSINEITKVCKAAPKHLQDDIYEITPPKTNDLFAKYIVRIDSDYGVYWLKAIGKDIYTNGYGDRLISTFNLLVESIRKTYGEESYKKDDLKEGSIWSDPQYFMVALEKGDRELYAMWSKLFEEQDMLLRTLKANRELLNDSTSFNKFLRSEAEYQDIITDKISTQKSLPNNITDIGVFTYALSPSSGWIALEYSFSNGAEVKEKADSVF